MLLIAEHLKYIYALYMFSKNTYIKRNSTINIIQSVGDTPSEYFYTPNGTVVACRLETSDINGYLKLHRRKCVI